MPSPRTSRNGRPPALATAPDLERIAQGIRLIIEGIGEDPERPGLRDTPRRVARMYAELCGGLTIDASRIMKVLPGETYSEVILLRDIPFHSICEHHLLPFTGRAHIAYLPHQKICGISKLARVLEAFARRPQIQERLSAQVADEIERALGARGVAVVLEAEHLCMIVRGVQKPQSRMVTSALRGTFLSDPRARQEVMTLLKG
jgi:GTP cyclohydrolase I